MTTYYVVRLVSDGRVIYWSADCDDAKRAAALSEVHGAPAKIGRVTL